MVSKAKFLILSATLAVTQNCTNYDLLDQLENPGGGLTLTAFAASATTTGDLSSYSAGIFVNCGGLAGLLRADCACQTMATNAGLPMPSSGKYIAFMSAAAADMTCRISGTTSPLVHCAIPSGGPNWATPDGKKIAKGYSGLLSGNLSNPLNITEYKTISSATLAWTGTQPGGQAFNNGTSNCGDFTVGSVNQSVVGDPNSTTNSWLNTGTNTACTVPGTMYCIAKP